MILRVGAAVALGLTLLVNYLANALPLGGRTTGEISDGFSVLFVPAGYVFAIWGVIYLALAAFVTYQFTAAGRRGRSLETINWWFILSSAFNIAWIFAWHYGYYEITVLLMLGLLTTLVYIYQCLGVGLHPVPRAEFWFVQAPFSLYLGWIIVATVANVTAVLHDSGWNGWGLSDAFWAVLMIAVATAIGLVILRARGDRLLNLVLVWALVGIALEQWGVPVVAYTAIAAALVIAVAIVLRASKPGALALPVSPPNQSSAK